MPTSPLFRRGRLVIVNAARQLVVPLENLGAAWLVVTFRHADVVWGAFVGTQIIVGLSIHVLAWGNKDWLLRAVASEPAALGDRWRGALWSRARFLPLAMAVVIAVGDNLRTSTWACVWLTAAFISQSIDAPILVTRKFASAVVIEGATTVVLFGSLIYPDRLDPTTVVRAWAVASLVRAVLLFLVLARRLGSGVRPVLEPGYLTAAAPFFLLGLSGMLQSKMDLYMANLLLDDADVGRYQIVINTFLMIQAGGAFLVVPFATSLYRAGEAVARRFARSVVGTGLALTAAATGAAWVLIQRVFAFGLPPAWFALGALLVIPVYGYLPQIYRLFGRGRERLVVVVNLVGSGVNLAVSVVLILSFGVVGALAGAAIAQWTILGLFWLAGRRGHDDLQMS